MSLTLAQANRIVQATLDKGIELGLQPLTVAVLDAGGHLIALQRQDGSSNVRPQIAVAKATGALALGMSSRTIGEVASQRPTFISAVGALTPGGLVPSAGGLVVTSADGAILGAVGVTGDTSDNDESGAAAGVAAAGLCVRQ